MVVLNRIYTRTGDKGETGLGSGKRVPKYDLRIEVYGTVDKTNACVGVARLGALPDLDAMLRQARPWHCCCQRSRRACHLAQTPDC